MSRGTGREQWGKQGIAQPTDLQLRNGGCCANSCLLRDFQHAFHLQQRVTQRSRNPTLQTPAGPAQPPPNGSQRKGVRATGEQPGGTRSSVTSPRVGLGLWPCSPNSPSEGFLPQISLPRAGWAAHGAVGVTDPQGRTGPIPTAAGLGRVAALATFPGAVATPVFWDGSEQCAGCLPAGMPVGSHGDMGISVGTGEQAELQTPPGHKQHCPPAPTHGALPWGTCAGTACPRVQRGPCVPQARLGHDLQGRGLYPERL